MAEASSLIVREGIAERRITEATDVQCITWRAKVRQGTSIVDVLRCRAGHLPPTARGSGIPARGERPPLTVPVALQ
jgi:hypothetical protein